MSSSSPDDLFVLHQGLAYHVANRFRDVALARSIEMADVRQESLIALWSAWRHFDPSRGYRFSSFAGRCIVNHLLKGIFRQTLARTPPVGVVSLDSIQGGVALAELLAADEVDVESRLDARQFVAEVLPQLDEREAEVLRRRFGLDGHSEHTFQQIGEALGITRARAGQIAAGALRRLRQDGALSRFAGARLPTGQPFPLRK